MPDPEQRPPEPAPPAAPKPGFLARGRRRARLRKQLAVREQLLLELGAIVYELHRQGQRAPELLQARAAQLDEVDAEVRALQAGLDGALAPASPEASWQRERGDEWDEHEPAGGWHAEDGAHDWADEDEATRDWEREPEDEWDDDPDEALDETQEWSASDLHEALGSSNGSADAETQTKREEEGR